MIEQPDLFLWPIGAGPVFVLSLVAIAVGLATYISASPAPRCILLIIARSAAVLAIAYALAGPAVIEPGTQSDARPRLTVLIDTSGSMSRNDIVDHPTADESRIPNNPPDTYTNAQNRSDTSSNTDTSPPAGMSRLDLVRQHWLTDDTVALLQRHADLRWMTFDHATREFNPAEADDLVAAGLRTSIADAVSVTAATWPSSDNMTFNLQLGEQTGSSAAGAVLLLSDGRSHDDHAPADVGRRAAASGLQVFAAPVGGDASVADLAIELYAEARTLLAGESTRLQAVLRKNVAGPVQTDVDLYADDKPVASRRIVLDDAQAAVMFNVTPPGPAAPTGATANNAADNAATGGNVITHYRAHIRPLPSETFTDNNNADAFVDITRAALRVAVFEGSPYWDTTFLTRMLARDPRMALTLVHDLAGQPTVLRFTRPGADDANATAAAGLTEANHVRAAFAPRPSASASPIAPIDFSQFDVIVLGRSTQRLLPPDRAAELRRYVESAGGVLILSRGLPFDLHTPAGRASWSILSPITPVAWGRRMLGPIALDQPDARLAAGLFRDDLQVDSPDDSTSPRAAITHMPDLIAATFAEPNRSAAVLMRQHRSPPRRNNDNTPASNDAATNTASDTRAGPNYAAIVTQRVGDGRVLVVLTDGLWRWAFLPSSLATFDSVHARLWTGLIRWLALDEPFLPGRTVALIADRAAVTAGQTVNLSLNMRRRDQSIPFSPTLTHVRPGGERSTMPLTPLMPVTPNDPLSEPGSDAAFRTSVALEAPGVHRFELSTPGWRPEHQVQMVSVRTTQREMLESAADPIALRTMAEASGGAVIDITRPADMVAHLDAMTAAAETDDVIRPAAHRGFVFAIVLLLLTAEWVVRRREGWR